MAARRSRFGCPGRPALLDRLVLALLDCRRLLAVRDRYIALPGGNDDGVLRVRNFKFRDLVSNRRHGHSARLCRHGLRGGDGDATLGHLDRVAQKFHRGAGHDQHRRSPGRDVGYRILVGPDRVACKERRGFVAVHAVYLHLATGMQNGCGQARSISSESGPRKNQDEKKT